MRLLYVIDRVLSRRKLVGTQKKYTKLLTSYQELLLVVSRGSKFNQFSTSITSEKDKGEAVEEGLGA